jgi:hypothetical protein
VHKRLLEGLGVPGLIGWEYAGHTSSSVWQEPQAYAAVIACATFNSQLAYLDGSSGRLRPRPQPTTYNPPLLSATVHLRRAAVLLELCLLFPEVNVLQLALQCMHKEFGCMYHCLNREVGSTEATWSRVYNAVTRGIAPTLLQQLLPVLTRVLQRAVDEQVEERTAYNKAAAELGILLAEVLQGEWLSPFRDVADCGTTIIVAALASCAATDLLSSVHWVLGASDACTSALLYAGLFLLCAAVGALLYSLMTGILCMQASTGSS